MRRSGSPSALTATTCGLSNVGTARYSRMPTAPISRSTYLWLSNGMRASDNAAIKESGESSAVVIAAKDRHVASGVSRSQQMKSSPGPLTGIPGDPVTESQNYPVALSHDHSVTGSLGDVITARLTAVKRG